jgi:hypothetical protein
MPSDTHSGRATVDSRVRLRVPGHPIADANGVVLRYRFVRYEALGGRDTECRFCNRPVSWRGTGRNKLIVVHLDRDQSNDALCNLAPACYTCNAYGRPQQIEERFWGQVHERGECCEWKGKLWRGSGDFAVNGTRRYAHRFAYEFMVADIPAGLQLDHLCRNPPCVRPEHLDPVTPLVNTLRSGSPPAINARKTHCLRGHPLPPYKAKIERKCRRCASDRRNQRRAQLKA